MTKITLHQVSFQLREPHPFNWLTEMGEVFAVFDQQDSGNLSFGVQTSNGKRFIKYAGARTLEYKGEPQEAVERLRQAIPIYIDLEHSHLVRLIDHFPAANGYAAVFEWFDGENLNSHWSFPPPAKYTDPKSPFYRYRQLPLATRLKSLDQIFSFHVHVAEKDYIAIDFYDGSIMFDFETDTTKICDIDLYHKKPFVNTMGRLWGSSRFMSPEEFQFGAEIDEVTNVFNMGATAFCLLGGERDRSFSKWEAGGPLYEVALKAVNPDRKQRYASLREFYTAWSLAAME
jgi:serine/threonine-protein kinase